MLDNCFTNFNNKCQILKVGKCTGHDTCSFFITKKDCKEGIDKVYKRLNSLDINTQITISEQYYNSKYPWKKGGISYEKQTIFKPSL